MWGDSGGDNGGEKNSAIFDVGPRTARAFDKKIAMARTIIWSGPLGLIEKKQYAKGSIAVARAITGTRWNGLIFFGLKNQRAGR